MTRGIIPAHYNIYYNMYNTRTAVYNNGNNNVVLCVCVCVYNMPARRGASIYSNNKRILCAHIRRL